MSEEADRSSEATVKVVNIQETMVLPCELSLTTKVITWDASVHSSPCTTFIQISERTLDGVPVHIYSPVNAAKNGPGIVYTHGGGWMYGTMGKIMELNILHYIYHQYNEQHGCILTN